MADICISYKSEEREIARALFEELSKLWDVWWDEFIVGPYDKAIEKAIPDAKCFVPILSILSRESEDVKDEYRLAKQCEVPIIPAAIDECNAPIGFGGLSKVNLENWDGEEDHPGIRTLKSKIEQIVPMRKMPPRPDTINGGKIKLPNLFHSVSSFETRLDPPDATRILNLFEKENMGSESTFSDSTSLLISAYDLVYGNKQNDKELKFIKSALDSFRRNGGAILLDSGNYEAARFNDTEWSHEKYLSALSLTNADWAFSFDYGEADEDGKRTPLTTSDDIIEGVVRDQLYSPCPINPIIHAPALPNGGHKLEGLNEVILEVARTLQPAFLAVPERELGPGLIEATKAIQNIRKTLSGLPFYQPLHILGTGDPWRIAVFTAAGADSFDGLEWSRYCVDANQRLLHHIQHFDFFTWQIEHSERDFLKQAIKNDKVGLAAKVGLHNLDFYAGFCTELRDATNEGQLARFVERVIGERNSKHIEQNIPGVFSNA